MASGVACVCRNREGRYQFMKWLIAIGLALIVVGPLWPWLSKLGLGRLPGDIAIERGNLRLYFPITTCLIVSVVLSFVFWLLNR
jgi:Protein of unknown function (DUF2905)